MDRKNYFLCFYLLFRLIQHSRYFRRLSKLGVWEKVLKDLVKIKRMKSGRNEHPSLMIVDAQSVKTAGKGEKRGFDGGKKSKVVRGKLLLTHRETFTKYLFIKQIFMIQKEELF